MKAEPARPQRLARGVLAVVLRLRGSEYVLRELDELFARRARRDGEALVPQAGRGISVAMASLRRARPRAVGGPIGEETRRMGRSGEFLTALQQAVRVLVRRPLPAVVSVVVLALAMGATTAVFSLLSGVTSPLSFREPDRLVRFWESNVRRGIPRFSVSAPNARDWAQAGSLAGLAAYDRDRVATLTMNGAPPRGVVLARCATGALPSPGRRARCGAPAVGR